MKFSKNRISYVKNPLARNSFLCLGLGGGAAEQPQHRPDQSSKHHVSGASHTS